MIDYEVECLFESLNSIHMLMGFIFCQWQGTNSCWPRNYKYYAPGRWINYFGRAFHDVFWHWKMQQLPHTSWISRFGRLSFLGDYLFFYVRSSSVSRSLPLINESPHLHFSQVLWVASYQFIHQTEETTGLFEPILLDKNLQICLWSCT